MERIDITLKRDGSPSVTLTFSDDDPDAARERLEFLTFILKPFAASERKPAERPAPKPATRVPSQAITSGDPK